MRKNFPITTVGHRLQPGDTLMSTTDVKSRIRYANDAFVSISGFTIDELVGQPHNLVRHPDMPPEAFEDMWRTLQAGEAWSGQVKNRCKNGDFYWVKANVTPVMKNGEIDGYLSVRVAPTDEEVNEAETLYRSMRNGGAKRVRLWRGLLLRRGAGRVFDLPKTMSLRTRALAPLFAAVIAGTVAAVLTGGTLASALPVFATLAVTALLGGLWTESHVVGPVREVADHARIVACGEPETREVTRVDEVGLATRSLNQMANMFRWIINDISGQVEAVDHASVEIARGNDNLSSRSAEAARKLDECAASMEEMSASVSSNAVSAQRAAEVAQGTARIATDGATAVEQMSETMSAISESSNRIREIIGVIDSIAFQTNILALNAAVEAARAGQHGNGFAVVADEVRDLAHRCAEAAKQIGELIEDSNGRVDLGVSQVTDTLETISSVTDQAHTVHELVEQINRASQEQSTAVSLVTGAVATLDSTTQQNSLVVDQAAEAAAVLKGRAKELAGAVAVFRG